MIGVILFMGINLKKIFEDEEEKKVLFDSLNVAISKFIESENKRNQSIIENFDMVMYNVKKDLKQYQFWNSEQASYHPEKFSLDLLEYRTLATLLLSIANKTNKVYLDPTNTFEHEHATIELGDNYYVQCLMMKGQGTIYSLSILESTSEILKKYPIVHYQELKKQFNTFENKKRTC